MYNQVWQTVALGFLGERICLKVTPESPRLQHLICISGNLFGASALLIIPHPTLFWLCLCLLNNGLGVMQEVALQCSIEDDIKLCIPHPCLSTLPRYPTWKSSTGCPSPGSLPPSVMVSSALPQLLPWAPVWGTPGNVPILTSLCSANYFSSLYLTPLRSVFSHYRIH